MSVPRGLLKMELAQGQGKTATAGNVGSRGKSNIPVNEAAPASLSEG